MIIDACVLIDYLKTDQTVLSLFVAHIGPIHVVHSVVEEVKDIDTVNDLIDLGLIIVEPELEDAFEASAMKGPTSFQDNLSFLTAKRYGFTCITNDKNLRRLCTQSKVPVLWGLKLLADLHLIGGIPSKDALSLANKIQQSNPKHITQEIITRFTKIIKDQNI